MELLNADKKTHKNYDENSIQAIKKLLMRPIKDTHTELVGMKDPSMALLLFFDQESHL